MDNAQDHAKLFSQFQQQVQQRHGICAAGHRHADAIPRPQHLLLLQAIKDARPESGALICPSRVLAASASH
jgi:hypothetical protein